VGWAIDASPGTFPSGVSRAGSSLNYNDGSTCAGANGGGALSPVINLAGLAVPALTFWCNYDTETRGAGYDKRTLEIWNEGLTATFAVWTLASVGYSFDKTGGLVGIGPGPCSEAYTDLETGTPVPGWHLHKVYLDPAWSKVRARFVFWTVDDLRNGYAGWAIDDIAVDEAGAAAPTGWPDTFPDTAANELFGVDGREIDNCTRAAGNLLKWSWGCNNQGDAGVHMIIGDHPQSILGPSFMFFDAVHNHWHMSQYSDFSLWKDTAGVGFVKLRRGPKRSFCLTDIEAIGAGPSISPGCNDIWQAISYNWQDVYALGTSGQEIDVAGLATGTDYLLVGVIDPINRLRETSNLNQADQLHFTLPAAAGAVTKLDNLNPYPPTTTALSVSTASVAMFNGQLCVKLVGAGFDTTLVPVMFDIGTAVVEAPMFTIVSATEVQVVIPAGITTVASVDLLRPLGDAASIRLVGPPTATVPAPGPPPGSPLNDAPPGGGGKKRRCGATGLELLIPVMLIAALRRRSR